MQTSAIHYRVADFLRQHPPFHFIEEPDLLTLVSRGRVKFHESDEFVCWQDASYAPFFFVVQQGSVSLWEESNGKEILRDIRGAGDTIGIERFLGSKAYPYSAKTNSDVVVYALHAGDFEPLLAKYPQAARYVDAYAAPGAIYRDPARQGVHEKFVVELARHPDPLACPPDAPIAEAARLLRGADASAIAVMEGPRMLGLVSVSDILGWVASGESASHPVRDLMRAAPPAIAPHAHISDCVLTMSRTESPVVALTADGTAGGGLLRLLGAADVQAAFGDNPVVLLREIEHASSIEVLRMHHQRARALLLAQLDGPSASGWLAALADRVAIAVVKRLTELLRIAQPGWTWCFWGAAGRKETLAPLEPGVAVICADSFEESRGIAAMERLRNGFEECGFVPRESAEFGEDLLCATAATWKERFGGWIHDPILNGMYAARPLFDLRPVLGDPEPWREVERAARAAIQAEPALAKLLAHDCQSVLPPLTFFENAVVGDKGERSETFALERRALGPLMEVGRVLGLAGGAVLGASTSERLAGARARMPDHEAIFRGAVDTLEVLLYLQARTGLRSWTSGGEVEPAQLSRLDRRALKTGFRAIHALLEFAYERLWKDAR